MSNSAERNAEDSYEAENDVGPEAGDVVDNSYAFETNKLAGAEVPVLKQEDAYDDPMQPPYSNSAEQLAEDENEAIDRSNIMKGDRLRHSQPNSQNRYNEGPDEEDLPRHVLDNVSGVSGTRRVT